MDGDNLLERLANLSPAKRGLLERRVKEDATAAREAIAIPPRPKSESAPLSFAQQRLWFINQLEPESSAYNEAAAIRLEGTPNVDALKNALNAIVDRHEVLRTTFSAADGSGPVQLIGKSRPVDLPIVDFSGYPEPERMAQVQGAIAQLRECNFDLGKDLMLRAALLRLDFNRHVLVIITHHIASDGWSNGIFWRELATLYEAFSLEKPNPLPELPIQYADYAVWQRQWLQGEVLEKQLSYWKAQLQDLSILELPTDRPPPPVQTYRGARQSLLLPRALSDHLKALSSQQGVTLFMTLLAALQTLLHRYTGQDDIVVGSPIAGRNRLETEGLIGFFVNTLVFRTDLSGNPTFRELLHRVKEEALHAYEHQDLPFERLVEALNPDRDRGRTPLFQVMFAVQNVPRRALEMPGLVAAPIEIESLTAKFDLFAAFVERDQQQTMRIEYNTDLFDDATIRRMTVHFQTLLESVVANLHERISELPMLTEAEKHQLLVEWNDTEKEYPKDRCIHELFEEQVKRTPEAVAVVFEGQELSYRDLNAKANRLAHHLRRRGVGPETLVAICMERSTEMIVGLLGILKAGGAYVPLDPQYPKERLAFMLRDTQAPVLLTQQRLMEELLEDRRSKPVLSPSAALRIDSAEGIEDGDFRFSILNPRIQVVCLDAEWEVIAAESEDNPISGATANNLVYVIYTSGSTGTPKGVVVPHRGITRLLFGIDYAQFGANQTFLHLAPTAFDASTFEIWGPLLDGGTCILYPGKVPTPKELGDLLHEHDVSTLWLTASLFNAVIDTAPKALSRVRQLLIGGEALSVPHVRCALSRLPNTEIINGYGPTESTTFTCCYRIPRELDENVTSIPIGRPIGNTQTFILDASLTPVPIGVTGKLYIGGDGLARGYLNNSELTAEKFVPNPFNDLPGSRLYRSGDLARYLPDGNIEFLGRIDHQVKIRGYRIELGEIECVLSQHPAVRETVVIAREDDPGEKHLVAYVVSNRGSTPLINDLRRFLRQKLPDHMVPSAFVFLDDLPLTPNGKVDRRALPEPDQGRPKLEETYVAPRTPVEEGLAGIWAEVLGLKQVGIHDNFFDLGGHSLKATQVMSRVRATLQVDLPLRTLFEAPTVAGLAIRITRGQTEKANPNEIASLLAELERMSDEEAESQLADESPPGNGASKHDRSL
ncbi:MAG: amino acid adenylation domain-containing protein [Deltaproteobacteria bacterium]|nr:amino acid adenylation domain-containing protein [Deltaproteobacteria bacterium]